MNAQTKLQLLPALEKSEIPTLIFGARTHLPFAVALIIRFTGSPPLCRAWLEQIEPDITFGHDRADRAAVVAFTATGLGKLGLTGDDLAAFPVPFQSGMTGPGRSRVLGDNGASAPEKWQWGYKDEQKGNECDALLILYAETSEILNEEKSKHLGHLPPEVCAAPVEIHLENRVRKRRAGTRKPADADHKDDMPDLGLTTEPFGFADGISQPIIRGTPRAEGRPPHELTPAGAFILGYEALDRRYPSISPLLPRNRDPAGILPTVTADDGITRADIGRNGTFLVVRQLEQNVDLFKGFVAEQTESLKAVIPAMPEWLKQEWVAAKFVGRWRNGASLVRHPAYPGRTPDNDFLFRTDDPVGLGCPLGAHIRRANPRDSLTSSPAVSADITGRHRILRVGRPYVPEEGEQPGILFMALNADIEAQFETIQQSWLNRADFHGLRDEADPLTGPEAAQAQYTIPTRSGPVQLKKLPDFVKTIGGGYFFMPSRAAIRYLASLKA